MPACGVPVQSIQSVIASSSTSQIFTNTSTTIAQCAEELLDLVNRKHSCHLEAAERECCRVAAEEAAVAGPSAPTTAFATTPCMAAAQHVRPLADKARAAEQMAAQAHEVKRAAAKALNEAAEAAAAAEANAAPLQEDADDAREAAGLQRK